MAKRLEFEVTNNQVEYEACIFGFEALRNVGANEVVVYEDSMLVVKQISKDWEVREDKLKVYWDYSTTILLSFSQYKLVYLLREENQMADALAILASTWEEERQIKVKPLILVKSRISCYEEMRIMSINPIENP